MFNPYFCRTEGGRYLSIVLSIVVVLAWWAYLMIGLPRMPTTGAALMVFVGPLAAAYLFALGVSRLVSWVRGFRPED